MYCISETRSNNEVDRQTDIIKNEINHHTKFGRQGAKQAVVCGAWDTHWLQLRPEVQRVGRDYCCSLGLLTGIWMKLFMHQPITEFVLLDWISNEGVPWTPKYSTAIAVAEKATVATCIGLVAGIAAVAGVDGLAAQNANKTTQDEDSKDDNHEALSW
ncbi:uncharacterized protein [Asterias amurensis]|uniref:uncharacterized protein isoform X1 n=1 Tax=Asterias amurensis TaxID=7602 RepID=UPI003AB7AC76